jgi:hypothetical protein
VTGRSARSRQATAVVAIIAAVAVVATLVYLTRTQRERQPTVGQPAWPVLGAYVGAGGKGAGALPAWERWTGVKAPYALDFVAADTWEGITGWPTPSSGLAGNSTTASGSPYRNGEIPPTGWRSRSISTPTPTPTTPIGSRRPPRPFPPPAPGSGRSSAPDPVAG